MSTRTLWRIEGLTTASEIDQAQLAEGLRLHMMHSPLTTVAMRIGEQQRCYLTLEGCAECARDHCRVGCPAALFRRLFQSCVADAALRAVGPPQGLARRTYARGLFAWPLPEAEPLDSSMLEGWDEARLLIHWRRYGARNCGSALLLVSAEGPEPIALLRAHRWRTCVLPAPVVARWSQAPLPPALPFGAPWQQSPFLLLPAPHSNDAAPADVADAKTQLEGS
jgi:hypothetical protein